MKIKAIESICKNEKRIAIFHNPRGVQWIGAIGAMYPLYSMPELSEETVYTAFDIVEDNRGKINYTEEQELPSIYDYSDFALGEVELLTSKLRIQYRGVTLLPVRTSGGIVYINKVYLSPFSDSKNGVRLCERQDKNGNTYLVVKDGMLLLGIILPYDVVDEDFAKELSNIADLTIHYYETKSTK